jgi:thiol-disulfide isomerase/thioredoxin
MNYFGLIFFILFIQSNLSSASEPGELVPTCQADKALKPTVDPSLLTGKVVLIDFWATWCPPCIQSIPFFNKLGSELRSQGFELLAINVDEDKTTVDDFLKQHPIDYPIAFDPKGECPKVFDVKVMPSSYLIDKNGKIRKVFLGFRDSDQSIIKTEILQLLSE